MTREELREQIRLIVSQCRPTVIRFGSSEYFTVYSPTWFYSCPTKPFSALRELSVREGEALLDRHIAAPGEVVVSNEKVLLLRTVYSAASPELQAEFSALLLEHLRPETAAVFVHVLVDVRRLDDVYGLLADEARDVKCRQPLWAAMADKLALEAQLFSDADLGRLPFL